MNKDNKESNKTFGVYKDKVTLMIGSKAVTFDINDILVDGECYKRDTFMKPIHDFTGYAANPINSKPTTKSCSRHVRCTKGMLKINKKSKQEMVVNGGIF